jgi:potassium/chloride transporter 9
MPALTVLNSTLVADYNVVQKLCFWQYLIVYAVLLNGFLAVLTGMMGCARVLQAMARDAIIPGITMLGKGYGPDDEPRYKP